MSSARYRILRLIKRGGMAEVFEAAITGERGFERRVALKRLAPEMEEDESFFLGFIDEARIASGLHHNNIVNVLDFGMMDNSPFQVFELVDGADLADLCQENLPEQIALHITTEIAHALDYAHEATDNDGQPLGIVHRDVNPQNILISWSGDVKLSDFGIAFATHRLSLTQVGEAKGKLSYMAPEQITSNAIDGRADIFSLGCVLHELLVGHSPTEDQKNRVRLLQGENPAIDPAIAEDLKRIIQRATLVDARKRYARASDMAAACGTALAKRIDRDTRTLMREWLGPLRPNQEPKPSHPLAEMMELELVLEGGPLRNFDSVRTARALQAVEGEPVPPDAERTTLMPYQESAPTPTLPSKKPVASNDEIEAGTVLHGYRILEQVGRGNLACVYRAAHLVLAREYAVKILRGDRRHNARTVARLQREAIALGKVNHPNVVSVVDCGTTPAGQPFVTMDLLRGQTLKEAVSTGAFSAERTANIARQLASGLGAAHDQGLVHRDLKPANIMLVVEQGREVAKILDFGLARLPNPERGTRLTMSEVLLGTPKYIAPEQISGAAHVGPAADLYALGLMMYFMLAGKAPFVGRVSDLVELHLHAKPPPLESDTGLEPLIYQLLEKQPHLRPQNAIAVVQALEETGLIEAERSVEVRVETSNSSTLWITVCLVGLVIAVLILAFTLMKQQQLTPPARNPPPVAAVPPEPAPPSVLPRSVAPAEPSPSPKPKELVRSKKTRPAKERKPKKKARLSSTKLRQRLTRACQKRGLLPVDLRRSSLSDRTRAFNNAVTAKDEKRALAELNALLQEINQFQIEPEIVRAKLQRINKSLSAGTDRINKEQLDGLENRYLDARSSYKRSLSQDKLEALALSLASLERDVARALR